MLTYSVSSGRYPHRALALRRPHSPIHSFRAPAPRVPLRRAGRRRTLATVPLGGPLGPSRSPAGPARPPPASSDACAAGGCCPQARAAQTAAPSRARRSSRATSSTRSAAGSAAAGSRSPGATPSARQPSAGGAGRGGGFAHEEPRSVWHGASPEGARRRAGEPAAHPPAAAAAWPTHARASRPTLMHSRTHARARARTLRARVRRSACADRCDASAGLAALSDLLEKDGPLDAVRRALSGKPASPAGPRASGWHQSGSANLAQISPWGVGRSQVIGPGCSAGCESSAFLTAGRNLPQARYSVRRWGLRGWPGQRRASAGPGAEGSAAAQRMNAQISFSCNSPLLSDKAKHAPVPVFARGHGCRPFRRRAPRSASPVALRV
jgi:hypothetical protein